MCSERARLLGFRSRGDYSRQDATTYALLYLQACVCGSLKDIATSSHPKCKLLPILAGLFEDICLNRSSAGTRWRATVKSPSPAAYPSAVPTIALPPSLRPLTISVSAVECEDRQRDAPGT